MNPSNQMRMPSVRHIRDLTDPSVFECRKIPSSQLARGFIIFFLQLVAHITPVSNPLKGGNADYVLTINRNLKGMHLQICRQKNICRLTLLQHWQKQILLAVFQHLYFDNKSAPRVGLASATMSRRSLMIKQYQHYINGAFCDPASGSWFDSENPYTGEVWAKIARGDASDVKAAVKAARAAFDGDWGTTGPTARGKLLVNLRKL